MKIGDTITSPLTGKPGVLGQAPAAPALAAPPMRPPSAPGGPGTVSNQVINPTSPRPTTPSRSIKTKNVARTGGRIGNARMLGGGR